MERIIFKNSNHLNTMIQIHSLIKIHILNLRTMEGVDSKIPRHLNTIFQIPPSRNCISHLHMDEKNQLQNSQSLRYNYSLKQNPHFPFAYR